MAQSLRYKDLRKELSLLRKHLLPRKFSRTGSYTQGVYTKTLAYRVLAHAEIEAYLEDRVTELYRTAISAFQTNGTVSKVLASMLAFSGLTFEAPPDTISASQPTQAAKWDEKIKLSKKLSKAGNAFSYAISSNNGIKEKNILSLLLPVGVESDEIDSLWLSTINSFGTERGLVAHSSQASYRTIQLPDPASELSRVNDLLRGLKDIDVILNRLMP